MARGVPGELAPPGAGGLLKFAQELANLFQHIIDGLLMRVG